MSEQTHVHPDVTETVPTAQPAEEAARQAMASGEEPVLQPLPEPTAEPIAPQPEQQAEVAQQTEQASEVPQQALPLLMDDWRFTSEPGLDTPALQSLLDRFPGPLKSMKIAVGDRSHSVPEILVSQATLYDFNPKIILTLLEQRHQLLTNPGAQLEPHEVADAVAIYSRELYKAQRAAAGREAVVFKDGGMMAPPAEWNAGSYAVVRLLARFGSFADLAGEGQLSTSAFLRTYTQLFEDPRQPLGPLAEPAAPFLSYPKDVRSQITSFFDHDTPLLEKNGSLRSYWGRQETRIAYDGHSGWDFGGLAGGGVLAAAPGTVIFAGNSNDGCASAARGVIIDHGNGYRTLYWHLASVDVQTGQHVERSQRLGEVGNTGCSAGPHLHFQVQFNGREVDPYGWCGAPGTDPWALHPFGSESRWLWQDSYNPCSLPSDVVAVTAGGQGFSGVGDWSSVPIGAAGETLWTRLHGSGAPGHGENKVTVNAADPSQLAEQLGTYASWQPQLPSEGRYRVLAYVPFFNTGVPTTQKARYTVHHADGSSDVEANQWLLANGWVDLGTYRFVPGEQSSVTLAGTGSSNEGIWAGTLIWVPAP